MHIGNLFERPKLKEIGRKAHDLCVGDRWFTVTIVKFTPESVPLREKCCVRRDVDRKFSLNLRATLDDVLGK